MPRLAGFAGRSAGASPVPLGPGETAYPPVGGSAAGFDPRRLAIIQAMLAGRDRAVLRGTDPRRREQLAMRPLAGDALAGAGRTDSGRLPPEGSDLLPRSGIQYPMTQSPEDVRAPRIPLDSDFIGQGAASRNPSRGLGSSARSINSRPPSTTWRRGRSWWKSLGAAAC